ncbi:MAG: XdhC family protein [Desulfobacteraceae bacterium]|nr:XdhC family protein [Desulfobacteraceae bacterium]
MRKNIEELHNSLKQGKPVVMVTILSKQGSAPRSAGTKMVVHENGQITGTIGGGWVEAQVQKLAKEFFEKGKGASIREFTLDSKIYADMDMVCGGNVTLLLEYLPATEDNIGLFSKLLEMLGQNRDGFMVSRLSRESREDFEMQRCIISGKEQTGPLQLSGETIAHLSEQAALMRSPGLINIDEGTFFVEPAQFNGTLYILGAGHLGVETARLAHGTGFKIVVMDDRDQFANKERFPMADVHVVDTFENCFDRFSIGHGSYIVIMTRGHLYDRLILEQALKTDATYIGMIGSKSKKKVIYDYLLTQGVTQERLDQVHAPIGLSIGAQTPAEIAVSIVAELIQARYLSV